MNTNSNTITSDNLQKKSLEEYTPENILNIECELGTLLNNNTTSITKQNIKHNIPLEYEAHYLENLFSQDECSALITETEKYGYRTTAYPQEYRGNLRIIINDKSLANIVWERVKPFIPSTVMLYNSQWEVIGLNECWRLSKYYPGDKFQKHTDAFLDQILMKCQCLLSMLI